MPTLYDTLKNYPSESLAYDKEFEIDHIEYELEHDFLSVIDITNDEEKNNLLGIVLEIGLSPCLNSVKIFLITNEDYRTCKFAVWGE